MKNTREESPCISLVRLKKNAKMGSSFIPNDEKELSLKSTVFENHRKSRIQHCERSELHLHFKWTKVPQKRQNWSILASFQKWDFFWRFFNTVIRDSDTSHCICYCSKGSNIKVSLSRLSNLWKSESESSSQNLSEFSQTSFHFPSQHF